MTDLQLKIRKEKNGNIPVCPRLDLIPKALPSPLQIPLIQDADPGHTYILPCRYGHTAYRLRPFGETPWPYCCIVCINTKYNTNTYYTQYSAKPRVLPDPVTKTMMCSEWETERRDADRGWRLALAMFCLGRVVVRVFREV